MQRRNGIYAIIIAIALLIWMVAGSYLFSKNCCSDTAISYTEAGAIASAGSMVVEDGDAFREEFASAILFKKNLAKPIIFEEVSGSLLKTIQYLKSNPLKRITIIGLFTKNESGGAHLASSRADSILQWFIAAGTPEYQLSVEAGQRDDLVYDEQNDIVVGAVDFVFSCLAPFEAEDAVTKFRTECKNNLMFKHSSNRFLMTPSVEMKNALSKLVVYLQNKGNRRLILTGFNHPDEKNTTALDNIGMTRANMVRNLLVSLGAKGAQIEIRGVEDERLAIVESPLYGKFLPNAMRFEFEQMSASHTKNLKRKAQKIEKKLKEKQVFRFKTFGKDENKIVVDGTVRKYIEDLILYLSVNQNATVYCVGHSNDLKSDEKNYAMGAERAQYTRDFLMRHGISGERIIMKSAGATHPLGEETTKYGQQINRRVDLFISYDGNLPKLYALPPRAVSKLLNEKEGAKEKKNDSTANASEKKKAMSNKDATKDSL